MKKKLLSITGLFLAASFVLYGCGSGETYKSADSTSFAVAESANAYDYDYESFGTDYDSGDYTKDSQAEIEKDTSQKIITTVHMDIETREYDKLLGVIDSSVKNAGGYVESSSEYNYGYNYSTRRNADLTVRIPSAKLDDFLSNVSSYGNVTSKHVDTENVTLQYVDLQSHKAALVAEESRLLELLDMAETLEDVITIEDKLTDVRYRIDSMESQLRTFDNKIDYSTVYISVSEVEVFTPVEEETVGSRIKSGFMESLDNATDIVVNSFVWFVSNLPEIVLFVICIAIAVFVIRKINKRSYKKRYGDAGAKKEKTGRKKAFNRKNTENADAAANASGATSAETAVKDEVDNINGSGSQI